MANDSNKTESKTRQYARVDELFRAAREAGRSTLSYEIFPPKGEITIDAAREVATQIVQDKPDFISVTCSAGGGGNGCGGLTGAIASMIVSDLNTSSVEHITCVGATEQSICETMDKMKQRGVTNVLALRGDLPKDAPTQEVPTTYRYARDLIVQLKDAGFCVGAAAYPEGHITCESMADNIEHLKAKYDAGADFFVTQLCFSNDSILHFVDEAQRAGINAPITCGIMPFLSKSQITRMVFMCGASLPAPVIKLLAKYENDSASLRAAGIEYACEQVGGLVRAGVDGVHVYSMNHADIAHKTGHAFWNACESIAGQGSREGAAGQSERESAAGQRSCEGTAPCK